MQEDLSLCRLIFIGQRHREFQIIDGKLMPPLSIDGLGDKAADAVVDAAKQGKFPCQKMISATEPKSARRLLI